MYETNLVVSMLRLIDCLIDEYHDLSHIKWIQDHEKLQQLEVGDNLCYDLCFVLNNLLLFYCCYYC